MRVMVAVILIAGCGGSETPLALLGKPCTATAECDEAAGIICGPIWLDAPAPEYACVMPFHGNRKTGAGCPDGTRLWVALLRLPDPLPDGPYQVADYCSPICHIGPPRTDATQRGDCRYGHQCIGVCAR